MPKNSALCTELVVSPPAQLSCPGLAALGCKHGEPSAGTSAATAGSLATPTPMGKTARQSFLAPKMLANGG